MAHQQQPGNLGAPMRPSSNNDVTSRPSRQPNSQAPSTPKRKPNYEARRRELADHVGPEPAPRPTAKEIQEREAKEKVQKLREKITVQIQKNLKPDQDGVMHLFALDDVLSNLSKSVPRDFFNTCLPAFKHAKWIRGQNELKWHTFAVTCNTPGDICRAYNWVSDYRKTRAAQPAVTITLRLNITRLHENMLGNLAAFISDQHKPAGAVFTSYKFEYLYQPLYAEITVPVPLRQLARDFQNLLNKMQWPLLDEGLRGVMGVEFETPTDNLKAHHWNKLIEHVTKEFRELRKKAEMAATFEFFDIDACAEDLCA